MALSPSTRAPALIPWKPYERRLDEVFNPPREPGKHPVKPWPTATEREWFTESHKFFWELPDAAYESFRAWVARVEAGELEALALAQDREINVVTRNPTGKRDELLDPESILFDIGDALHSGIFDDPKDRDNSAGAHQRRYELRRAVAQGIIKEIFGDDVGDMIQWITNDCYEAQGDTSYQMDSQRMRAEERLKLGIANARDHAIAALGEEYWR
jgi:hypothetical protein